MDEMPDEAMDDPADGPTVRLSRHSRRRGRKRDRLRLPPSSIVTVSIEDHPDGPAELSFASPDGKRWKAFAYWPKRDPSVRFEVTESEYGPITTEIED